MKRTLLSITALLFCSTAYAQDWPRWMGPDATGISNETGLAESWPTDGPKKLWSQPVGIGFASPIAVDGKIYLFHEQDTKDVLSVFDSATGKVIWTQSYDRARTYAYPGTRATPTILDGRIYTHGSNGDLVCRELADGKLVWQMNSLAEAGGEPLAWGQSSSPLIVGDLIYLQGGNGGATALAVEKSTGKVAWKSEANGMSGYATAICIDVAGNNQLVIFGGDAVYGISPKTGKTLWTEAWKTPYDVNAATPIFRNSMLLVTASRDQGTMMLSVTAEGAKKEWEKKGIASKFQPPILDRDAVYVNNGGTLACIRWPEGDVLWSAKGRDFNLGAGGSIVRIGNRLITMSERGKLSLIDADEKDCKLVSQVGLFDYDKVWSTPLIYNGKLYAKGKDELVCLDIAATTP